MTDQNDSEQTRRTFVKGAAATGVAATGITAFSGGAAANSHAFEIQDIQVTDQDGLVNVAVQLQDVDIDIVDDIIVRVRNVRVLEEGININAPLINVELEDVNIQALNNLNVIVQALSDGDVIQTTRQRVQV